ncbi:MAG: hypothetical protein JST16_00465 [Bdellovibrionales bacterium]|nr:hypothetical protein [Bdellovibrionales bacterium]
MKSIVWGLCLVVSFSALAKGRNPASVNVECETKQDRISFSLDAGGGLAGEVRHVSANASSDISYPKNQVVGFWNHEDKLMLRIMDENFLRNRVLIDATFKKAKSAYVGKVIFDSGGQQAMIDSLDIVCAM